MRKRQTLIALGLLVTCVAAATPSPRLPEALSDYRSWHVLEGPSEVPEARWTLCAAPDPNWETRAKGPHARRYIRVYANRAAAAALEAGKALPIGAALAKEKLARREASDPSGVAFMVKRTRSVFPESGG